MDSADGHREEHRVRGAVVLTRSTGAKPIRSGLRTADVVQYAVRTLGLFFSLSLACSFDGSGTTNPAGDGAPSDGTVAPSDMDGDQILDEDDNCPTIANPNQFNEDVDALGNLCDNCPGEDNPLQANNDQDDLGDLCDPQPGQANQMLYFEGFDESPDADDWVGLASWQVSGGSLVQSDNSERYYLRYEGVDGSDDIHVVSKIQFSSPLGPNGIGFRYGGVFMESNDDPDNNGCWLVRSLNEPLEGYVRVAVSNGSPTSNFPVGPDAVDNSDYVIASSVSGATRSCSFEHGAAPVTFDYSGSNLSGQGIGIVTSYTQARVAYFYAVRLQ